MQVLVVEIFTHKFNENISRDDFARISYNISLDLILSFYYDFGKII